MAALETPIVDTSFTAPDFSLKGTDNKTYSLSTIRGSKGTLVMFICNHCPYVKAQLDRIVADAAELQKLGIGVVAINSNDPEEYPEDSFENMVELARQKAFPFPYLMDETQAVAKAYGAVCTPDYFGFNASGSLQYRGRLDTSWSMAIPDGKRELLEAMKLISIGGRGPSDQYPSIGCSIKWRKNQINYAPV